MYVLEMREVGIPLSLEKFLTQVMGCQSRLCRHF